jgi:hypothetical protein
MGMSENLNNGHFSGSPRRAELEQDYATAWAEWETSGEQAAWDRTTGDGFADAAWCWDSDDQSQVRMRQGCHGRSC